MKEYVIKINNLVLTKADMKYFYSKLDPKEVDKSE